MLMSLTDYKMKYSSLLNFYSINKRIKKIAIVVHKKDGILLFVIFSKIFKKYYQKLRNYKNFTHICSKKYVTQTRKRRKIRKILI